MEAKQIKLKKEDIDWNKSNLIEHFSSGMVLLTLTEQTDPSIYRKTDDVFDGIIVLNKTTNEPIGTLLTNINKNEYRLYNDMIRLNN